MARLSELRTPGARPATPVERACEAANSLGRQIAALAPHEQAYLRERLVNIIEDIDRQAWRTFAMELDR